MIVTAEALALLSKLERAEATLLVWGVIEGALARAEVDAIAQQIAGGDPGSARELIKELVDSRLLVRRRSGGGADVYRTRMAETVRLAASLRQLFETNAPTNWRSAPRLVGDYRFTVRPRAYPDRNLNADDVLGRIDPALTASGLTSEALRLLLANAGDTFATFQAEAVQRILAGFNSKRSTGTVVSAGTGSGKTLAFYVPALAVVANEIQTSTAPWTKVVAIYPRNELLKDQFAHAYSEARILDKLLPADRPLTISAFFGPTPRKLDRSSVVDAGWESEAGGWLCPYMRCPACGEDSLIWRVGSTELICHRACGQSVSGQEVILSRDDIGRQRPDILFTTTEMLNRGLCSAWTRPVFGVGQGIRPPRAILLDEVHTYGGLHGAAVSLLLRRYRHALRAPLQLVGLSATLRDAEQFFATLVGLPSNSVATVAPAADDMIEAGAEYLLALRADPTSGRSVLSTSIQAAMLMRRMLDPWENPPSDGALGRRLFLFTDKLDIANRLFFDLRDAEGQTDRGLPAPWRQGGSLANLRSRAYAQSHGADAPARDAGGQLWETTEDIGFRLQGSPLRIRRTTSQDAGVDPRADIIVATASLDVGFNDPEVGAIIQHKAPRRNSQFLQRRGRAGRSRKMRPWTIVSLSDFGRDRVAYEGYDLLFDPELEPQPLPVDNRHVQRMQATYALLEWLEVQAPRRGSMWRDLAGPPRKRDGSVNLDRWHEQSQRRNHTIALLQALLADDAAQRSLATHLSDALGIEEEDVQQLLWDPPRALLTSVVPTAIRRLTSCWATARDGVGTDFELRDNPLPDFVPRSLFQSLNTPDVQLRVPEGARYETEPLAIDTTLREYCPGNVSQRLGIRRRRDRHWIAIPELLRGAPQNLDVNRWLAESYEIGAYPVARASAELVPVLRPLAVTLSVVPQAIKSSSAAFPDWRTNITPGVHSEAVDLSAETRWSSVLQSIQFFTHRVGSGVETCRFMIGAHASRLTADGLSDGDITFVRVVDGETERVGVGFEAEVDAVRIRCAWPTNGSSPANTSVSRTLRVALFLEKVANDPLLSDLMSNLGRRQLGELYLTTIVGEAITTGVGLQDAAGVVTPDLAQRIIEVADIQGSVLRLDEDLTNEPSEIAEARRPLDRLETLLSDHPTALERVQELATTLWDQAADEIEPFLRRRSRATVGGAFLLAFQRMCPDADLDQVVVDLDYSGPSDGADGEIWLTETATGGGGVLEEVSREALRSPRRLMRFLEGALQPSDLELIDGELTRILELREGDTELTQAFDSTRASIRGMTGVDSNRRELARLVRMLSDRGVMTSHAVVSAVATRLLRPGATEDSDTALLDLRRHWATEEQRLDIEIPLRAFSFAASGDPSGAAAHLAAAALGGYNLNDRSTRYGVVIGTLWPRGEEVRTQALPAPNFYARNPDTDRRLLLELASPTAPTVDVSQERWREQLDHALATQGEARIRAGRGDTQMLRRALLSIATHPSDIGYLHLFPIVFRASVALDHLEVHVEIRELAT